MSDSPANLVDILKFHWLCIRHASSTSLALTRKMKRFTLILLSCVTMLAAASGNELCSISGGTHFSVLGHYNHQYPLDVFFPRVHVARNMSCVKKFDKRENYTCPTEFVGCPMIEENFRDANRLSRAWPKATSLCSFREALGNHSSESRLIILGGSVTAGVEASGCCGDAECFNEPSQRCSWVNHLHHWLSAHKANLSVHNMANPGTTTVFTSEIIRSKMAERGLGPLSSKDLIFIDHSFNDITMSVPVEVQKLEKGLESLVRSLIGLSMSMNDIPHIVVFVADTRVMGSERDRYTNSYIRISEHYGLRYYSFADALMSNASMTKQASYHDHLTHKIRINAHPPWYVHLAYADLLAGLLRREMEGCKHNGTAVAAAPPFVMPAPVTSVEDASSCKADSTPFVHIDYNPSPTDSSRNRKGNHKVLRPNTWIERLDGKRRPGLIIEVTNQSVYETLHDAPVEYSLGITAAKFRTMSLMLQMSYLRSYTDAGFVSLYLCGTHFRNLDALWEDYERLPYTQREAFSEALTDWCKNLKDDDDVVLTVRFKVTGPSDAMKKMLKPRGNQRFKIEFVLLCEFVPVKLY